MQISGKLIAQKQQGEKAVINSSHNLIIFHVLFAEIQRSLALESEKVERLIRNITFILQSPTFQGPRRNFFFLLANDFSNKNINHSQLISDSEFS